MKRSAVYFLAFVIVAALVMLLLFFGPSFTGNFLKVSEVNKKSNCVVSSEEVILDLANSFSKKKALSSKECSDLFNEKKEQITSQICLNSANLLEVNLLSGSQSILKVALDCPESLLEEDPEASVTFEGIFYPSIEEDFGTEKVKIGAAMIQKGTGKAYDLKVLGKDKNSLADNFAAGSAIKIRAKEGELSSLILETEDAKSIRKI